MKSYLNEKEYRLDERFDADGLRTTVYAYNKAPRTFRKNLLRGAFNAEVSAYCAALEAEGYTRRLGQMEKDLADMTAEEKIATASQLAKGSR